MIWHKPVLRKLEASRLFSKVSLVGAKVRAVVDEARFLDLHFTQLPDRPLVLDGEA